MVLEISMASPDMAESARMNEPLNFALFSIHNYLKVYWIGLLCGTLPHVPDNSVFWLAKLSLACDKEKTKLVDFMYALHSLNMK